MKNSNRGKKKINRVDCALFFMLDEERDYFLQFNTQFIIKDQRNGDFLEFIFFDKHGIQRNGVICSNGTAMGNTEACAMFYKFSRHYIADLYINLGVSGIIKDVNIGDVVVASRISTLGEQNATDSPWQLMDVPYSADEAKAAVTELDKVMPFFSETTKFGVNELKDNLTKVGKRKVCDFDYNVIKNGWCVTVPEVIKGENGRQKFPVARKINIVDMEAYYLVLWHSLIKKVEPHNSVKGSKILVFKSASDYGDDNKQIVEECGSRKLAMTNLCAVVSNYCTLVHEYPQKNTNTILDYFKTEVIEFSADELVMPSSSNFNIELQKFESLCSCFIDSNDESFDKSACVSSAFTSLSSFNKAIILTGRSGTAKSTFMSYLYFLVENAKLNAVLVDFSKYTDNTVPSSVQLVYLLEKLLRTVNDLYVFIDGINTNSSYYYELLEVLEKENYKNISYCIGDVIGCEEPVILVPKRMNVTNIEFSGISMYSDEFDSLFQKAEEYFNALGHRFDVKAVKEFVMKSKITNVDFRLLSMLSNRGNELEQGKSLYSFLNNYIISKFGRTVLSEYRKSSFLLSTDNPTSLPAKYSKIYHNTYANSLAVSQEIIDIFEKNDIDRINNFIRSKYVLSDDMNLFLSYLLKNNRNANDIVNNIINILSCNNHEISVCVETQLLYNICGVVNANNNQYDALLQLLKEKVERAKKNSFEDAGEANYTWAIQYRTLCIILNQHFNIAEYLHEYNDHLINDSTTSRYNLFFHFLYYSKSPFTFDHIDKFHINFLSRELFYNTYYVLKNYLEDDNIEKIIVSNNPFAYMNIITYLQLVNEVMINMKRYTCLIEEVKCTIKRIHNIISDATEHSAGNPAYLGHVLDLSSKVLHRLNP